jgi:two-component system NtrC family response regulator
MVQRRQFRKDLLFRLRAFTMELPPLRERLDDIKEIALHQINKLCECYGVQKKEFSPDFFDQISRYEWPGNVRELVSALERAVSAASHEPVIFPKHLPIYIRVSLARASVGQDVPTTNETGRGIENSEPLPKLMEMRDAAIAEVEQRYLRDLMKLTHDMSDACRISGLSRSRLYALLKKYGIPSCFRIA